MTTFVPEKIKPVYVQKINDKNDKKTSTFSHHCEASPTLFWLIYVRCIYMLNFSKCGNTFCNEICPKKFMNSKYLKK